MDREARPRPDTPTGAPQQGLWRELNQPHPFDPQAVRLGCSVLVGVLAVFWCVRPNPLAANVVPVRTVLIAHALVGAIFGPRFTWVGVRVYTVLLGLLLPLGSTWISAAFGNQAGDLPVTALATFVGMAFLQAGWDFAIVAGGLLAGNLVLLRVQPPSAVPAVSLMLVVGGAIATGAAAGLVTQTYNALYRRSMTWWRDACERERALREFAELTTREIGSARLLDGFAEHLRTLAGATRCLIALGALDSSDVRIVATAGFPPEDVRTLQAGALKPGVTAMLWRLVEGRRPVMFENLPELVRARLARDVAFPIQARWCAALPVTVEDAVAGVVVLTAFEPRTVDPQNLLLWQAMANQAGVAIANAQLLSRLRRALGAKSEFLNTMSHELRSPLHVIVGYTDMLRESDTPADRAQLSARIRASAVELLQLVENTMHAARLDSGKMVVHVDEFALDEVVQEVAEGVRVLPEAKSGVPVRWEIAPAVPRLQLDRLKLKEILQNLVSNALKFTRAGAVSVSADHEGEELRIAVQDTGPGIPRDAQARIFEMFERVESMDGHRPAGIGLGLYIVKSLVQLMGGRIEVESEVGRGTRFTVRLPLRLARAA